MHVYTYILACMHTCLHTYIYTRMHIHNLYIKPEKVHPVTPLQTFNNNKHELKFFANDQTGQIKILWPPFPRSRSFEVIFPDKVPLTPSNISTKFRWNNQIRLGKSTKM